MPTAAAVTQQYPIRAVARMTGLSVDTLRAWERRYDAVVPRRSGRGRVYGDADVLRLKQLADLVRRGHQIGSIAALPTDRLAQLLRAQDALTAAPAEPDVIANLDALIGALDRYDLSTIETTLNRHALLLPPRDLVFAVVLPLLREIGARWEAGELRPAQEHLVSAMVRSVLGGLLRAVARPHVSPVMVCATPAGERHELGLLCAAILAASAGHGVVYLGADLPTADIADAVARTGAHVVMIAVTTPGAVSKEETRRLARATADVQLWVGGPEASALLAAAGDRARHVPTLDAVIPMLARHGA